MSRASFHSPLSRRQRVAGTVAAAVCAAGVQLAVLSPFHRASADDWINPGPQLAQALDHCNSMRQPSQRDACVHQAATRARVPATWTALAAKP